MTGQLAKKSYDDIWSAFASKAQGERTLEPWSALGVPQRMASCKHRVFVGWLPCLRCLTCVGLVGRNDVSWHVVSRGQGGVVEGLAVPLHA